MRGPILAAALVLSAASLCPAHAQMKDLTELPGAHEPYPLVSSDISIHQALRVFAKTLRARLMIEDGLSLDETAAVPEDLSRQECIDMLAEAHDLVWHYDGLVLRIEPVQSMGTRIVSTGVLNGNEVLATLDYLGILQAKFVHRVNARRGVLRISGPNSYVEMLAGAVESMVAAEGHGIVVSRGSSSSLTGDIPVPDTSVEGGS